MTRSPFPLHVVPSLVVLLCGLCLGACTTVPPPAPTLYERIGGRAAIAAVVDDAIVNFGADPRINARFGNASIPKLHQNLVDLLCLRSGGPCTYRGADMASTHEGMHIRSAEFDALIEDLVKSLDKLGVPAREKGEVLAIMRQMKGAIIDH